MTFRRRLVLVDRDCIRDIDTRVELVSVIEMMSQKISRTLLTVTIVMVAGGVTGKRQLVPSYQ